MTGAWLLAALVAAGAGTVALDLVGEGLLGTQTQALTQDEVAKALAAVGQPATSTRPSTTQPTSTQPSTPQSPPSSAVRGAPRGLTVPGGSIVAECTNGLVTLTTWTPDPGYRSHDVNQGPAAQAFVKFKADRAKLESRVTITCLGGEPQAQVDDHH
ncbi:hypothetical protein [Lentzea sp. NPDC059081]|uniref:hypothetical protein n=1 Tax=Lentzea sp. NPDC059081 TaxID=3346719 RepID=UPI0036947006